MNERRFLFFKIVSWLVAIVDGVFLVYATAKLSLVFAKKSILGNVFWIFAIVFLAINILYLSLTIVLKLVHTKK